MIRVMSADELDKQLIQHRKAISKASEDELSNGVVLQDAVLLAVQFLPVENQLEQLALLLVLFRQLKRTCDAATQNRQALPSPIDDLLQPTIAPNLQPNGILATLIVSNLEHQQKARQLRASEVLHAAAKLSLVVPPPPSSSSSTGTFLAPLFRHATQGVVTSRPVLTILSSLADCVQWTDDMDRVLQTLLNDVGKTSMPNVFCAAVVIFLHKRRESSAEESAKDEAMIAPLLPYFDPAQPPAVATNLMRYILPALLKPYPSALTLLLRVLDGSTSLGSSSKIRFESLFPSWIAVAALGVSLGIMSFDSLSPTRFRDAMMHQDPVIRLRAFELASSSKDPLNLLEEKRMSLIKESLRFNAVLPNAGNRSDLTWAVHAFFERLGQAETAARRAAKKARLSGEKTIKAKLDPLAVLSDFHQWFLADFADHGLTNARRPPVMRALLSINLLSAYIEVFETDSLVLEAVFTEERVQLLFSCQASEFTELRNRARAIIQQAPSPLPGHETISAPSSQAILRSAFEAFANPRKTQNEAATAGLCILFEKIILPSGPANAVVFVESVVQKFEKELSTVESGFKRGMEDIGLHGLIGAVHALISCADLRSSEAQADWTSTLHTLRSMMTRIWMITRVVISLSPQRAANHDGPVETEAGPEHEIARAYEILAPMAGDEEDYDSVDPIRLISGCWRATKEASELLATLVELPLAQGGNSQEVWTKEEVASVGQQFLTWMHEIRHRGTFSKVALAFARLVEAIKPISEMRDLVDGWLNHELEAITDGSISTTRRSAALPYSVLSIVSGDERLLDQAVGKLIGLGKGYDIATSDVTKVHALNILKIVLLDAKQAKALPRYFERAVMTAVDAFASSNWNVRNVGLILFSTLIHRVISPARSSQDLYQSRATLASRQTIAAWHARFPSILPFVIDFLRSQQAGQHASATERPHSPLFPILIIVRSLRYSDTGRALQTDLRAAVEPYLGSSEWQVRAVAAQAFSSLLAPAEAAIYAARLAQELAELSDLNDLHGRLLLLKYLISDVIDWSQAAEGLGVEVEQSLLARYRLWQGDSCPLVLQAVINNVQTLIAQIEGSPTFVDEVLKISKAVARTPPKLPQTPGHGLARAAAIDLLLRLRPTTDVVLVRLAGTESDILAGLSCLPDRPDLLVLPIFEQVLDLATSPSSAVADSVRTAALDLLGGLSRSVTWPKEVLSGIPVKERKRMAEMLTQPSSKRSMSEPFGSAVLRAVPSKADRRVSLEKAALPVVPSRIHRRAPLREVAMPVMPSSVHSSAPLKEAALPAVAWAAAWSLVYAKDRREIAMGPENWLRVSLEAYSAEDRSQPARWAAVRALRNLQSAFFPGSADAPHTMIPPLIRSAHQVLIRLLQDDDEAIRIEAAEIIRRAAGYQWAISVEKAWEVWWTWLERYLDGSKPGFERREWERWMFKTALDEEGLKEDLDAVRQHGRKSVEVLFELERQNLFRDPLNDGVRAGQVLLAVGKRKSKEPGDQDEYDEPRRCHLRIAEELALRRAALIKYEKEITGALADVSQTVLSPIDDAWEAARMLERRLEVVRAMREVIK